MFFCLGGRAGKHGNRVTKEPLSPSKIGDTFSAPSKPPMVQLAKAPAHENPMQLNQITPSHLQDYETQRRPSIGADLDDGDSRRASESRPRKKKKKKKKRMQVNLMEDGLPQEIELGGGLPQISGAEPMLD